MYYSTSPDGAGGADTDTGETYTYRTEPAAVGGARYVRCKKCGCESVLAALEEIFHAPDYPETAV